MQDKRNGNKGIQVTVNKDNEYNMFYGYYYSSGYGSETFQVVDAKYYATERQYKNFCKKYGF